MSEYAKAGRSQLQARETPPQPVRRYAAAVRWASLAVIAASVIVIAWTLDWKRALEAAKGWIAGLGPWGPAGFVLAYATASLLLLPGSALTLPAGVLFGLFWGTVLVSVASTLAAAAAFLIARYVARGAVERLAARHPRFAAIDRAIGEGGWRIVLLLRLSPVFPYSPGNYLFGLTPISFWPYVLASWLAMLPGTFLYVYVGHVGAEGIRGAGTGRWILMILGLIATVALIAYVTHLARHKLRAAVQTPEDRGQNSEISGPGGGPAPDRRSPTSASGWSIIAAPVLAVFFAALAVACVANRPNDQTPKSRIAPRSLGPSVPQSLGPSDEHNRRLVESLHPPHWINPVPAGRYNLVVVGAGTAGLVCTAGGAGLGAKVALIERALESLAAWRSGKFSTA